jgi:hypothetical protein
MVDSKDNYVISKSNYLFFLNHYLTFYLIITSIRITISLFLTNMDLKK